MIFTAIKSLKSSASISHTVPLNRLQSCRISVQSSLQAFAKMDVWQKSLLIVATLFFSMLFVENFILSQSFTTLQLREIDDIAFQTILREIHQDFSAFHLDRIFRMNYYGYGWSFWIVVSVLTYPFYLMAQLSGFFMPLILLPRMLSLAFVIGTALLVYKSLSIYSKNEFLKFVAIVLLLSFPAFGSFGLYFRTTAQVMFFSALTFYLAISKDNYDKQDLKKIALAAGICVGTKLNGVMILPLVGLIMMNRMRWEFSKENFAKAVFFIFWLLVFIVVLINPMLVLAPFKPRYFFKFIELLQYNSHMAVQENSSANLIEFIQMGYANIVIAIALICLPIFAKNNQKKDLIFIALWLILCVVLLSKFMMMGAEYMVNYFTVVAFLAVFGIITLDRFARAGKFVAAILLLLSLLLNWQNIYAGKYSPLKFFYVLKNEKNTMKIDALDEMKKIIGSVNDAEKKVILFMDPKAIFPYSDLAMDNVEINFSRSTGLLGLSDLTSNPDYIVLDRDTIYFLPDDEFKIESTKMNEVDRLQYDSLITDRFENKKLLGALLQSEKINGNYYHNIFDKNGLIVLRRSGIAKIN